MSDDNSSSVLRVPAAGLLAWLVPGLGHIYLGQRLRGVICLVIITVTFWSGVAIGGVSGTVNPQTRKLWFFAQLCTGGNALAAYALNRSVAPSPADGSGTSTGPYLSAEVGVHYTGVAGLLNVLLILDAMACADPSGRYRREEVSSGPGVP